MHPPTPRRNTGTAPPRGPGPSSTNGRIVRSPAWQQRRWTWAHLNPASTCSTSAAAAHQVLELAARAGPRGHVLGADISAQSVAWARERLATAGLGHAEVIGADVATHPFVAGSFDLAFSRLGVMFFHDPTAAFTNVHRAMSRRDAWRWPCSARQQNAWPSAPRCSSASPPAAHASARAGRAGHVLVGRSSPRAADTGECRVS